MPPWCRCPTWGWVSRRRRPRRNWRACRRAISSSASGTADQQVSGHRRRPGRSGRDHRPPAWCNCPPAAARWSRPGRARTTPGTTVYLVTDTGMRYPVAGQRTLEQLGLTGVECRATAGRAGRAAAAGAAARSGGGRAAGVLSPVRAVGTRARGFDSLSLI